MKNQYLLSAALIIIAFVAGIYLYPQLPDPMPSHWNASGEVDSYMEKDIALFMMPAITVFLFGLFLLIPRIDPLKKNIEKFRSYYDWFILLMVGFFTYIYFATIAWALGYQFNMSTAVLPPVAVLLFCAGILCEKSKRNWFIGVRTPWTLSNDAVWRKTNDLAGKLFKVLAVVLLVGILFPAGFFPFLIVLVLLAALYPVVYSYFEYQKEIKKKIRK
jgi:uncharacterized membrane protein